MITNIDLVTIKKQLKSLKPLIKANISFYDDNFKGTYACTDPATAFCLTVKSNLISRCADCDYSTLSKMSAQSKQEQTGFHYNCHFGLKEFAFKMVNNEDTYGYIIVGPFRDTSKESEVLENINIYCQRYNVDKDTMLENYYDISEFSEEKFEAIKTIIFALFDNAINKKIIKIKSNVLAREIVAYIQENLQSDLFIDNLAKMFFISEKKVCSLIKYATGMLPKEYITQTRILKAQTLLDSSELSIKDIASQVGISDYNYFTKIFRKYTGLTPTQYRQQTHL